MKNILQMKATDIIVKETSLSVFFAEKEDAPLLKWAEDICFANDPWSEATFRDAMDNPACRMFILQNTQSSKMLGYGVIHYCLDEADLANIAILPEERGKGLGGLLLDIMLEDARNNGVLRTFLEVRESNASARGLYASRNFYKIGKRRRYYKNPCEDAVIMVREELN